MRWAWATTATSTTSTPGSTNAAGTWPGWSYDAPAGSGNWYGIKNNTADTILDE